MQAIATVRGLRGMIPARPLERAVKSAHPIDQHIQQVRMHPAVRAIVIPPCPESLLRLQAILAEPEIDASALDQLASGDVAMAAALIRLANSPLHALAHPVQTVGMALTVLGLHPSVELLTAFITRNALMVRSPLLEHFWESSRRRAMACEHIGRQLYSLDPGLGYSFGLFCHVGMPVLVKAVRGYGSTVTEALARKDRTFTQTENANHRTDHAVMGAIVARTWHLPGDVAQAIWLHHDFACLGDERFNAADKDHDGYLSRAETKASMPTVEAHFDKVDANHDGHITREDLRDVGDAMSARP